MSIRAKMLELERRCPGTEFIWQGEEATQVELRFWAPSQHGSQGIYHVDLLELGMTAEEWLDAEIARWPAPEPERDAAYGVICPVHGPVQIGFNNYCAQLSLADAPWTCPKCGREADFDDDRLEEHERAQEGIDGS